MHAHVINKFQTKVIIWKEALKMTWIELLSQKITLSVLKLNLVPKIIENKIWYVKKWQAHFVAISILYVVRYVCTKNGKTL